jgi:ATP-dependent helicase/nuclease subunit A
MSDPVTKPAGSSWTDEQWQAMTTRGHHLLVAAAAGSGKTAVLVERIIRTVADEKNAMDIDRLLVATFTDAAAAEMRHRLREALDKALRSHPRSKHLRTQLALLSQASITTLHSFCLQVVRRYVQRTNLDPSFRIANETEAQLLRQEAIEAVFEQRYMDEQEDSPFWKLADAYGGEHTDEGLIQIMHHLYDFSRSHPFPEHWLSSSAAMFQLNGAQSIPSDHPWLVSIEAHAKLELEGIIASLRLGLELATHPAGPNAYIQNLSDDIQGMTMLQRALSEGGWRSLYDAVQQQVDAMAFNKLKPQKKGPDEQLMERVKSLRKKAAVQYKEDLKEKLLTRTLEQYAQECHALAPLMEELVRLVDEFAHRYASLKKSKALVDFSDLEHACLHILLDPASTPEHLVPSDAAIGYQDHYQEVYVDEYQDTNEVQETILRLVSRGETPHDIRKGNRFMVGDVKQSIYRFRLAQPRLFLHKYKTYTPISVNENSPSGIRIDLARNFRSRQEVVDAVNYIFYQTMHEAAAELEYDEQAELVYGAGYPNATQEDAMATELLLIDPASVGISQTDSDDEDEDKSVQEGSVQEGDVESEEELAVAELEARAIGMKIKELFGSVQQQAMNVQDKALGGARPIRYRDIVILLRAVNGWAPIFVEQFKQLGIPVHADLGGGYFDALEVVTMISLLQTIDNPLQDIPLAAVLRSPLFGFSSEELGKIRIAGSSQVSFYEALGAIAVQASHNSEHTDNLRQKITTFLVALESWRTYARQNTLADLIMLLYRETGYLDFVGGLPGGEQRQANLRALYDRARQYEATSLRGLFRFLRFIERLRSSGADLAPARALGEQENVVRIMTIHKSKGLEFPVVFIAGLGKNFNRNDEKNIFLIHKELGFGPKVVDTAQGIAYPTLPMLSIRKRLRAEAMAEEMRILYVAMTRAREKLILLGSLRSLVRTMESWTLTASEAGPRISAYAVVQSNSFLDWIGPALLRHPASDALRHRLGLGSMARSMDELRSIQSRWNIELLTPGMLQLSRATPAQHQQDFLHHIEAGVPIAEEWTSSTIEIAKTLGWSDPRAAASVLYAKTSVTEWKRRLTEEESDIDFWGQATSEQQPGQLLKATQLPLRRPSFMASQGLTPAERGTAYHAVMQHLPLQQGLNTQAVAEFLDDLVSREIITRDQRNVIDPSAVRQFLESEPGQCMLRASSVYRELPFSVGLPASIVYGPRRNGVELDAQTANERVLVQGVIDCLFETPEGWIIVDYKTDFIQTNGLDEVTERYRQQLDVYARAVEQSLHRPVVARYLYFFAGPFTVKL